MMPVRCGCVELPQAVDIEKGLNGVWHDQEIETHATRGGADRVERSCPVDDPAFIFKRGTHDPSDPFEITIVPTRQVEQDAVNVQVWWTVRDPVEGIVGLVDRKGLLVHSRGLQKPLGDAKLPGPVGSGGWNSTITMATPDEWRSIAVYRTRGPLIIRRQLAVPRVVALLHWRYSRVTKTAPFLEGMIALSRVRWSWALWVLSGTLVRFAFGLSNCLWTTAPDQLAWGMGLDELFANGEFAYKQLVHYPHEGGSLFISLLALLFRPLGGVMPPLSWVALALDTVARSVQIRVARRSFGDRTATWFAAWTVLGAPLMLPWATVNFGLHALLSFAPFLLVQQAVRPSRTPFVIGLCCGLLASLAYDVWVFAPAFLLWSTMRTGALGAKLRPMLLFVVGSVLAFLPHLLIRACVDHGFGLEDLSPTSIRGFEHEPIPWRSVPLKFWSVWSSDLPASFTLAPLDNAWVRAISWVIAVFIVGGLFMGLRSRAASNDALRLSICTVLSFTMVLAVAPFFVARPDGQGYLYYRYFPFIAPLLVLVLLEAYGTAGKVSTWLRGAWVLGCSAWAVGYMVGTAPCATPNFQATGWVLARKYGDDPQRLMRIIDTAPRDHRSDLYFGSGWGLAAALFDRKESTDLSVIREFDALWSQYPAMEHAVMKGGVLHAFDPGITPVLDPALRSIIADRIAAVP